MCGIVGAMSRRPEALGLLLMRAMASAIAHRGPDDSGQWEDVQAGVALGHRRLSVLDLSPAGRQPMFSHGGRYVVVFNGEIYNHLELRDALGERPWRGHSDTETFLAACEAWGIEKALTRSVGMFALAVWDRDESLLTLARDRLGEKPLYYGWQGEAFLFASELKAIRRHPAFEGTVDRNVLALFLRHNYVPAPYSIYKGIYKLPPGTYYQIRLASPTGALNTYWSARSVAEAGQKNLFAGSDEEGRATLERVLLRSVRGQMLADVPLGAFLSGGVDSSTVVALMQLQSMRPVKTFTIGFHEQGYDEAGHARAVAHHLGTEHTELYVKREEAQAVIPLLPGLYDEPFADSSQIPTYLVSRLARAHVTVSLSGDGGDELFGGYNRYAWAQTIWRRFGWFPISVRAALAGMLTTLPPAAWDHAFNRLRRFVPGKLRYSSPGDKLHKLADILAVRDPEEMYLGLVSHWKNPDRIVIGGRELPTVLNDASQWADLRDLTHRMMYLDTVSYLPDDILVKVDRAAMGVSLETRVPLLDHRVLEFAWTLPLSMTIREGRGKWLLRQVLYRHVPMRLIERPKMGFGVPLDVWLRGPLKNWAAALLDSLRLEREGYFHAGPIRQKWEEHCSGRRNWSYYLWDVVMFQAWLEVYA